MEHGRERAVLLQQLNSEPMQVAQVLRSDPRLDKAKIGEYIGAANNKDVLTAFVKSFDFREWPSPNARLTSPPLTPS